MQNKNYLTPKEIRTITIENGINKCNLQWDKMLLLAILAGIFIAFGAASSNMAIHSISSQYVGIKKLLAGMIFPVGLMMIVIAGGELFTGNNLIIMALLEGKVKGKDLLNNWVIVFIGNFIGSLIIVLLLYHSGLTSTSNGLLGELHISIAKAKLSLGFKEALVRGILCNILVVMAVWMASAAKSIGGKIVAIWFPIMAFVTAGFEHCIANMYYIPFGILAAGSEATSLGLTWSSFIVNNLIPVTLGNIIGGAGFIGVFYWYIYKVQVSENKSFIEERMTGQIP